MGKMGNGEKVSKIKPKRQRKKHWITKKMNNRFSQVAKLIAIIAIKNILVFFNFQPFPKDVKGMVGYGQRKWDT